MKFQRQLILDHNPAEGRYGDYNFEPWSCVETGGRFYSAELIAKIPESLHE